MRASQFLVCISTTLQWILASISSLRQTNQQCAVQLKLNPALVPLVETRFKVPSSCKIVLLVEMCLQKEQILIYGHRYCHNQKNVQDWKVFTCWSCPVRLLKMYPWARRGLFCGDYSRRRPMWQMHTHKQWIQTRLIVPFPSYRIYLSSSWNSYEK